MSLESIQKLLFGIAMFALGFHIGTKCQQEICIEQAKEMNKP